VISADMELSFTIELMKRDTREETVAVIDFAVLMRSMLVYHLFAL